MNTVLFVDDELMILNALKRVTVEEPYEKLFANGMLQALEMLEQHPVSVLVTDMKMPGGNGLDLLKKVKTAYPDVVKIVLSGYTHLPQVLVTVNQGDIFRFISKPWDEDEFKEAVREAVDYFQYKMELRKAQEQIEKRSASFQTILKSFEDRLQTAKEEMALIRSLHAHAHKEVHRQTLIWDHHREGKEALLDRISAFQSLASELTAEIPMVPRLFNGNQLVTDIKAWHAEERLFLRMEAGVDASCNGQFKGAYGLLKAVVVQMIRLMVKDALETHLNFVCSVVTKETGVRRFQVVLSGNRSIFARWEGVPAAMAMLLEAMNAYEGEIVQRDIHDVHAIMISIGCS